MTTIWPPAVEPLEVLKDVTVGAAPAGVKVNWSAGVTPVVPEGVTMRMSTVTGESSCPEPAPPLAPPS